MNVSLDSITQLLESKNIKFHVSGPQNTVESMAAMDSTVKNSLCYYVGDDPAYVVGIQDSIIICKPTLETGRHISNTYIFTEHPQLAYYYASVLFEEKRTAGVHQQSVIDQKVQMGSGVSIGAFCVLDECRIGDRVVIENGVRIQKGTMIGNDVHIQAGSVIGAEGFMWTWDGDGNKVSCVQTGHVIIEDNVSLGSNIVIVRGAFPNKPTVIGRGTMIAHGTMIGHGVVVGARNHFANNVAIAGTVSTAENCFFGSGAVVRPHVKIAANTIVGAGAVVVKDVQEQGQVLVGNPARPMAERKRDVSGVPASYSE